MLFFYFIAGEKCNFQVQFAFVQPHVCKNWLKLGNQKRHFSSGGNQFCILNKSLKNLLLCPFCSSPFSAWILLPVLFFTSIAGEKCNFQVKFAFVHPPVCKNWLKLGKAKTSFFFRYTLGCQTSKFTHKYLLENMQKFSSLQFIWRYVYKSVKWVKMC